MIYVQLTNGFGNNLFQYNAGMILGKKIKQDVFVTPPFTSYYAIKDLQKIGMRLCDNCYPDSVMEIDELEYGVATFSGSYYETEYPNFLPQLKKSHIVLTGYFEDFTHFIDHIDYLKSLYPTVHKRNNQDLVVHFRAGDRLFYKNEFDYKPQVENYIKAINQFDFEQLHIVTDMSKWDYINKDELAKMKFHYDVPYTQRVEPQMSVDYFNSIIEGFKQFNPIIENRTVYEDFNFIRSFDNILFEHGTMSWWASVLSEASKVGVYGPWRAWKGSGNKNLSNIPLKGWFKWQ
tara:strand:+ start:4840 stop:5709 length:870 start_codon:yes stop_codon:yes gene_type:complete